MSATKSSPLLLVFVQLALVCSFSSAYKSDRLAEIEKQCSAYLSSAMELNPNDVQEYNLEDELSFSNGEWEQEPGGAAPLMPFDQSDMFWDWFSYADPLRSVSLKIAKQDSRATRSIKDSVLVGGVLSIGLHRKGSLGFGSSYNLGLSKRPGFSSIVKEVKGVYIETKENDGERLLCLLGSSRSSPISYIAMFGTQPEADDLVLLVLRYPGVFNMTSQAIMGEMVSLSRQEAANYFDRVRITSQLSHFLRYQFNGSVDSRDLHVSHYRDELIDRDGPALLSSREFCRNLRNMPLIRFSIEEDDYMVDGKGGITKIGPFFLRKEDMNKQSWQHEGFNLVLKPIKCDDESGKVSVVLRVVPESMDQETAVLRTGISGATMIAEGMWDPSSSQLSMVGCAGGNYPNLEIRCNSRVLLQFPKTLSLTQRSVTMGSISSIADGKESFSPLRISVIVCPDDLVNYYWYPTPCEYNYSESKLAQEFWERNGPSRQFSFISSVMKKAVLRYPSFGGRGLGEGELFSQLSHLSEELSFRTRSFPVELRKYHKTMYFLQAEMLSVGPLCSRYSPWQYNYTTADDIAAHQAKQNGNTSRVINVSVHLTYTVDDRVFTGRMEKSVTYLFLEGLYDTSTGEMNLVGCGDVEVGRSFYVTGPYVDCLMAVRIRYSAVNCRWLKNPTVAITIMSQRNDSDPLYFQPFTLRQISVYSPTHQQDVVFRLIVEGLLRVLLLVLDIGCIYSQLLYMRKHPAVVPRISLVMLGIQILGYLLPLIKSSEILIEPKESNLYAHNRPYRNLGQYWLLLGILDWSAKCLLLVVVLLFTRLFREVARSRTGSSLRGPTEEAKINIPDDRKVLLIVLAIHILGFALLFVTPEYRPDDGLHIPFLWKKAVLYFEIVDIFFLLPQVLMNSLWNYSGIPPVRRMYLIIFILSRWVLRQFNRLRDPILDPHSQDDWGFGLDPFEVSPSGELSFSVYILSVAAAPFVLGSMLKLCKLLWSKVFRFLPFIGNRLVKEPR